MALSNDLISQFVKATKDEPDSKKETTFFGTVVESDGSIYVKLDGSDQLTPIATTADVKSGERVTVMIKNHTATLTGNISSPAARTGSVQDINKKVNELDEKVSKFDSIAAGSVTTEQLDAERARINSLIAEDVKINNKLNAADASIKNLESDNVIIHEKLTAADGKFESLEAVDVDIKNSITAHSASIENLKSTKLDTNTANIRFATVDNLNATNANVTNLEGRYATFVVTTTDKFNAIEGNISDLNTEKLDAEYAEVTYAKISELNATNANITNLSGIFAQFELTTSDKLNANDASIKKLETEKLSSKDIEGKFANIDFSNIGKAAMEYFYANSGLIEDVVVGEQTITGKLVGVTINGDRIEGNTIIAEKLVIKGDDGLYYKLNTDGVKTETEQTDYNSLNGQIIKAKSITATKIAVDDLVAFGATIGGFNITTNAIYSGVKESATNSTRGVYLDKDGQVSFGDSENFVKYYKDQNGNYKLEISADSLTLGSQNKNIETAINDISEANSNNATDLANYIVATNKELTNLQGQIDGSIMTWFYEYVPTNNNLPASQWTTVDLKNNHLGDLFYDTITGYCYRWQVQNNIYGWNRITDVDVTKALADAAKAQDTADNKRRVFVSTPTTPYDIGDLWVQGASGEIMRCETPKLTEQTYAASDWVKASKYTDDTKANAAQAAANTAQADVNAVKTRVSAAETQITQNKEQIALKASKTEVTETLSGYYTKSQADAAIKLSSDSITQNVSKTYATQTELNNTNTNVTNAQNTANSAKNTINNLKIGGRNLATGTNSEWTNLNVGNWSGPLYHTVNGINNFTHSYDDYGFKEGEYLTFAIDLKASGKQIAIRVDYANANGSKSNIGNYIQPDNTGRSVIHIPFNADYDSLKVYIGSDGNVSETIAQQYKCFKVEKGNRATDWTTAPEDVEGKITQAQETATNAQNGVNDLITRVSQAETKITQNSNTITLTATKSEVQTAKSEAINASATDATNKANNAKTEAISAAATDATNKANNAKDSAIASASADATNKANTALNNAKTYTDSKIKIASDSITSSVSQTYTSKEEFAKLSIGGRNLLPNSEIEQTTTRQLIIDTFDIFAEFIDHEVVISFDAMVLDGGVSRELRLYPYQNNGVSITDTFTFIPTTTWQRFSFVTTIKDWEIQNETYTKGAIGIYDWTGDNNYSVRRIKIEFGNRATDWTPAPEDMATADDVESVSSSVENAESRLTTAETLIQQLSDSISTLVTDGNGQSLMTQTSDGWTFSTAELQDIVDSTSENLNELTNTMGDVNSAVRALQQAVNDLGILNNYIRIGTYEDEPCIELGQNDNDFKLIITNTRIMFMEGTGVPAYINNQSLYIKNAVVEEELQQGEFVWKVRSNGNLGLVWKGGSS